MKSKKIPSTWGQVEITPGAILYHQMYVRNSLDVIKWVLFIIVGLLVVGLFV